MRQKLFYKNLKTAVVRTNTCSEALKNIISDHIKVSEKQIFYRPIYIDAG
jgi:hypothetical protein